jgi:hypothetical protein
MCLVNTSKLKFQFKIMYPELIPYNEYVSAVPISGQVILAHQREEHLLVYQAYNHAIANFAVKHQYLGGSHFKYSRMSWIKPNFLWMMFRCGWTSKENQERVLGLWIKKSDFDKILAEAVYSSYQEDIYGIREAWQKELEQKEVRLQWDPDHDLFGNKVERRAIQLGLKGRILESFGKEMISEIVDMTEIVKEQKQRIDQGVLDKVLVPKEWELITKS